MSIRRGRLRSTIKWGGAVLTVLLLIVWVGSAWCGCAFFGSQRFVAIQSGRIEVGSERPNAGRGLVFVSDTDPQFRWWFDSKLVNGIGVNYVMIPLWPVILLAGAPTLLIWLRDRRMRLLERGNRCPKCGYDRTGLPADRACPECGTQSQSDLKH